MDKIKSALIKVASYLTPAQRKAIYLALGAAGAALVGFGVLSEAEVADYVHKVGYVLDTLALILAALNVPGAEEDAPTEE